MEKRAAELVCSVEGAVQWSVRLETDSSYLL